MKYNSITHRKIERAKKLKRLGRLLELLKVIAIVGILLLMSGCATKSENEKIVNNCLDTAKSYGDYVECAIQLDEAQR